MMLRTLLAALVLVAPVLPVEATVVLTQTATEFSGKTSDQGNVVTPITPTPTGYVSDTNTSLTKTSGYTSQNHLDVNATTLTSNMSTKLTSYGAVSGTSGNVVLNYVVTAANSGSDPINLFVNFGMQNYDLISRVSPAATSMYWGSEFRLGQAPMPYAEGDYQFDPQNDRIRNSYSQFPDAIRPTCLTTADGTDLVTHCQATGVHGTQYLGMLQPGQSYTRNFQIYFYASTFNQGDSTKALDLSISGLTYDFSASDVPEPATWAMLLVGFGFVGTSMRRHRRILA